MLARRDLTEFFESLVDLAPEDARNALREYLPLLVDRYGSMAAAYAADWYDATYGTVGFRAQVYEGKPAAAVAARSDSASVHLLTGHRDMALAALTDAVDRLVKQPGRTTVARNSEEDPRQEYLARIPRGLTCDWCLDLASHGPMPATAKTRQFLDRWHGACDCQLVALSDADELPDGYDPDAYHAELQARQAEKQQRAETR